MKTDRLIGILTYLLRHKKATAPQLAAYFEVSRRTILRDVDALCLAGIPIVTAQGGGGGISIMEGFQLDSGLLSSWELASIVAGLRSIGSVSKTSQVEQLVEKLAPGGGALSLHNHMLIDLASHYRDSLSEKIALISTAISNRKIFAFDYYYSGGEERRRVEPLLIQFKWNAWYLLAWCQKRGDFRLFKLGRLWNPEITEESFSPREIPKEELERGWPGPEPHVAYLLFDNSQRFRLIEEYGLNCYEERNEGLYMELRYTVWENTLAWILGFGDLVTVLGPEQLRRDFGALAQRIAQKYRTEH